MKILKKTSALLLVLVMLLSLSACSLGGKSICGEWHCSIDFTDTFSGEFSEMGIDLPEDSRAYLIVKMTFNEDGTVVLAVDKEKSEESMTKYLENDLVPILSDYLCDMFGQTQEELEEELGMSMKDYILDAFGDPSGVFDTMEDEHALYETDGDKLYLFDEGAERNENEYVIYELKGGKLYFNEFVGVDSGDEFYGLLGGQMPLVFEK